MIFLVDSHVVGDINSGLLIQLSSTHDQRLIKLVQFLHAHPVAANRLHDFLLGFTVSTVCQHTHEIGNAHRRNHLRIHSRNLLEEVEGKLVVLLQDVELSIR